MRIRFIPQYTYYTVRKYYPWTAIVARCEGGFMAFESMNDYRNWRRQQ